MRYPSLLLALSLLPAAAQDASLVRRSDPLTPAEEQAKLKVPPGFKVQLIASEPVINKPMNIAFDAKGRMWVTSSREYPWAVKKELWKTPEGLLENSPDKIVIFEDTNADGLPDKPRVFADNLNISTGVLPIGNGNACIAWSIPNIWKLEDTDGDGKCDKRTILFGPLGWEKDTHGMISSLRMGSDGWVYATHGFSNTSHFKVLPQNNPAAAGRPQKPAPSAQNTGVPRQELDWGFSLDLQSGSVFRFKPDGSAVEPWTWGQVNPFGLCQDSYGSFYTADCHSNPITQLIRFGMYQSFGKPHDGMGFAPVMCEHAHGSTGLCGVVYIDGGLWGPEWDNHSLVGNCVTSRINLDYVTFTGATPKANEKPDFLVSEDLWFRPVDLRIGPDGALYVADFYNRIIGHYEVPLTHPGRDRERGRLWRITKEGSKKAPERTPEQEMAERLRLNLPVPGIAGNMTPRLKQASAEALISKPDAAAIHGLFKDLSEVQKGDDTMRHTLRLAIRACLQLPDGFASLSKVADAAKYSSEIASIATATQSPGASAWLLNYLLTQPPSDRGQLKSAVSSLAKNLPGDGEAKLIGFVKQHFAGDSGTQLELAEAIRQGIARRGAKPGPEATAWLTEVAGQLFANLEKRPTGTRWDPAPDGPWTLQDRACADGKRAVLISSLGSKGEDFSGTIKSSTFACPDSFSFYVCGHRGAPNKPANELNFVRLVAADGGAEIMRASPPRNDTAQKITWDLTSHAGKQVRLEIVDGDNNARDEAYAWLAAGRFKPALIMVPDISPAAYEGTIRTAAQMAGELSLTNHVGALTGFLSLSGLTAETRSTLAAALSSMGQPQAIATVLKTAPWAMQIVLGEILAGSENGATALMECGVPRLLTQPVVAQKIAALNNKALKDRAASLTKDLPPASAETDALIAARIKNHRGAAKDLKAGHNAYLTHCAVCHRIGNEGNVVGPQLDGAGNRGIDRLCEDLLDPNRAVDPMFRMHIVTLKDGTIQAGLIRRDDAASLVLVNATGQEITVLKSSVARDELSPLSLMPATFGVAIPEADFHNLLAWLASQKSGAAK
ncbi:MAG TPA: PVC-type heme-binding CxxCH protein [Verrucomicrobiales bacterium]|nr:PVC-type heme-binding CxxCH protein [Verrucomicrobiales bacterium]